jgi:LuxR family transcriptional regulator, positive regulator of biofilm formation
MKSRAAKSDSLNKRTIQIVSARKLQCDLMANYLTVTTGVICKIASDPGAMSINPQEPENSTLVLLDCPERDPVKYFMALAVAGKRILSKCLVALFNVRPGLGIEERAVSWGIRGFFYETDSVDQMMKGIQTLFKGEMWLSRDIMAKCIQSQRSTGESSKKDVIFLTQRELEILSMVVSGATNEEIAARICISPHTVKTHIYNIFKKISVPNRLQAALWAAKNL